MLHSVSAHLALGEIHKAGYLLGTISLSDIVIRKNVPHEHPSDLVCFVSFGDASNKDLSSPSDQRKMVLEEVLLWKLLCDPSKNP